MVVQRVGRRVEGTAGEQPLHPAGERRVGGEGFLEVAVLGAGLLHDHAAVAFEDAGGNAPASSNATAAWSWRRPAPSTATSRKPSPPTRRSPAGWSGCSPAVTSTRRPTRCTTTVSYTH